MIVSHSFVDIDIPDDYHAVNYCSLVDQSEKVQFRELQEEPRDWDYGKTQNQDSF